MKDGPNRPNKGVSYELKAVEGSRLQTLLSLPSIEAVMRGVPTNEERVLSIWAVSGSVGGPRLVAVKDKRDSAWTVFETLEES